MKAKTIIIISSWTLYQVIGVFVAVAASAASHDSSSHCPPHRDLVVDIPGVDPSTAKSSSCWYSGYLEYTIAGQDIYTHYTFMTSENTDIDDNTNNSTIPLIYWSNGGPGASSLFGLLTELGPYLLSDLSLQTDAYQQTNIPTPIYNPYTWTKLGHLLSFDQPAPIGFSYCNTVDSNNTNPHSCGGIVWNDTLTSQAAFMALQQFYALFPMYQTNDLYLTGESYAGIYIPTLAREIVNYNNNNNPSTNPTTTTKQKIPLMGFAVGDGCLGTETGICGNIGQNRDDDDPDILPFDIMNIAFLAGHGQISMKTFVDVMNACQQDRFTSTALDKDDDDDISTTWRHSTLGTKFIHAMVQSMSSPPDDGISNNDDDGETNDDDDYKNPECQKGLRTIQEQVGGVYAYGLYDDCTYRNGVLRQGNNNNNVALLQEGLNDYPCGGDIVMRQYLSLPIVRSALHVEGRSDFFSVDNAEGDFDYIPTEPDLTGFYREMNGHLRILVYNGDTDPAINSFQAYKWTTEMYFKETQPWRPWTVDGCRRMGGYVTRYKGNFDFLTIRGAGHMVPTNKAEAAFTFMKSWIENVDYPIYDKDCVSPHTQQRVSSFQQ